MKTKTKINQQKIWFVNSQVDVFEAFHMCLSSTRDLLVILFAEWHEARNMFVWCLNDIDKTDSKEIYYSMANVIRSTPICHLIVFIVFSYFLLGVFFRPLQNVSLFGCSNWWQVDRLILHVNRWFEKRTNWWTVDSMSPFIIVFNTFSNSQIFRHAMCENSIAKRNNFKL